MAQYINMKQVPNGTVTAKDDRIVYDANLADSGIIYGCDIAYTGNNMIHINAGYGIIKGGLFEIEDHTEYVEFAESGTLHGQIYLHLDLSADDKLTIVKETAASLHPMTQNANANFENGIYEMQLCTFEATATTLQNVTQTFSVVSAGVLDSLSEIAANTTGGLKAGALAVKELNNNLTANSQPFRFGYDSVSGKYGYILNQGGADTVIPFKTAPTIQKIGTLPQNETNNTINVKNILPNEYSNLTANNFIIEVTSMTAQSIDNVTSAGSKNAGINKSYNASTGILTFHGGQVHQSNSYTYVYGNIYVIY